MRSAKKHVVGKGYHLIYIRWSIVDLRLEGEGIEGRQTKPLVLSEELLLGQHLDMLSGLAIFPQPIRRLMFRFQCVNAWRDLN